MYPKIAVLASSATGTGALAETGIDVGWQVLLALTLLILGMTVIRLVPRRDLQLPTAGGAAETGPKHHRR